MNRLPWFRFYPADWIKGTRELSASEKAIWIDLLCYMWEAKEQGVIQSDWNGIARMTGTPWLECEGIVRSLVDKGVLEMSQVCPAFVRLMSRRMSAECHARENARERQQKHRESERLRKIKYRNGHVTEMSQTRSQKSEVIKDKDIRHAFKKPTLQELQDHLKEKQSGLDAEAFYAFYESNGWRVGKNPMKSWKAAVTTWEKRNPLKTNPEVRHWSEISPLKR